MKVERNAIQVRFNSETIFHQFVLVSLRTDAHEVTPPVLGSWRQLCFQLPVSKLGRDNFSRRRNSVIFLSPPRRMPEWYSETELSCFRSGPFRLRECNYPVTFFHK